MNRLASRLVVQVACPAYTVTGGPEALHQLVHVSRQMGVDARIVYQNKRPDASVPPTAEPFRVYDIRIDDEIENDPGVMLIVPETETELLNQHRRVRKAIWWLSIDNYWIAANIARERAKAQRPARWWKRGLPQPFDIARPDQSILHLAQSHYARSYLQGRGLRRVSMLTDYLRDDFLEQAGADRPLPARQARIAYNPKKGLETTQRITERLGGQVEFIRIENMSPAQVVDVLRTSTVYMDFGHHPGRDRIPREAAICGCCIVTGRKGSAANAVDMPIPEAFKIDEGSPGFLNSAVAVLTKLTEHYEEAVSEFQPYRQIILGQKKHFEQEVAALIAAAAAPRRWWHFAPRAAELESTS
jgi:hypothetical protein